MPIKLLIADNSVTIHKVVDLAFEDEDVHVFTAGDGQEALDKTKEIHPDIIIADSDMPKLNGFELCQKIKADKKLKEIPLCLLHSDFEEFDEEKFRSSGADDHLSKPFKSEDLINKVSEMVKKRTKIKEENAFVANFSEQEELQINEKQHSDLEDLNIAPLNEVEEEIEKKESPEFKPTSEKQELTHDRKASLEVTSEGDPSEQEIAKLMEEINEWNGEGLLEEAERIAPLENNKMDQSEIEKELKEFDKVLNIPKDELGKTGPHFEEKPADFDKLEIEEAADGDIPDLKKQDRIEEKEDIINEDLLVEDVTPPLLDDETTTIDTDNDLLMEGNDTLIEESQTLKGESAGAKQYFDHKSTPADKSKRDAYVETDFPDRKEKDTIEKTKEMQPEDFVAEDEATFPWDEEKTTIDTNKRPLNDEKDTLIEESFPLMEESSDSKTYLDSKFTLPDKNKKKEKPEADLFGFKEKYSIEKTKEIQPEDDISEDKSAFPWDEGKTTLDTNKRKLNGEKESPVETSEIAPKKIEEEAEIEKIPINKTSGVVKQFTEDDFERLIGPYIKQTLEKTLKESIQNELVGITDKIIEAIEKIVRENTHDVAKAIIQNEIKKLKEPKA